jgi:DNA-3-methyladenine glycosylase
MFDAGGAVYVYRCYGLHNLFNIVTNTVDNADAILVRAIEPIEGAEHMLARRNITMDISKPKPKLCCGPGNMSKALGINTTHYGLVMPCDAVWVSEGRTHGREEVVETVRVGIDYAEEDALLPWRFYPKDCKWISKK